MTMKENQFKAFIIAKKVFNILSEYDVFTKENYNMQDFVFDGIYFGFDLDSKEVTIQQEQFNGDGYTISVESGVLSESDELNQDKDYPDWVVYRLGHLYDFLKS